MAEGGAAKPIDEYEKEMIASSGPTNIREVRAYENKLDEFFEHFKKPTKRR